MSVENIERKENRQMVTRSASEKEDAMKLIYNSFCKRLFMKNKNKHDSVCNNKDSICIKEWISS